MHKVRLCMRFYRVECHIIGITQVGHMHEQSWVEGRTFVLGKNVGRCIEWRAMLVSVGLHLHIHKVSMRRPYMQLRSFAVHQMLGCCRHEAEC